MGEGYITGSREEGMTISEFARLVDIRDWLAAIGRERIAENRDTYIGELMLAAASSVTVILGRQQAMEERRREDSR